MIDGSGQSRSSPLRSLVLAASLELIKVNFQVPVPGFDESITLNMTSTRGAKIELK